MSQAVASTSTTRQWQEERTEEKFDRVLQMSTSLPEMRRRIAADMRRRGLERDRVLALALQLLDLGYFRAGGEQYADENNSFGIATLLCEHVTLQREAVEFDFPAKSGVRRTLTIDDPEVVRSVRALLRRPDRTDRLLACRNSSDWADIRADDLNARFKELVGDEYTVKDLRTWHGTVLAAVAFVGADPPCEQDGDQAGRIRGDEGGGGGAWKHPCGGPRSLMSTRGWSRATSRASRSPQASGARQNQEPRRAAGDPGGQHRTADSQGGPRLSAQRFRFAARSGIPVSAWGDFRVLPKKWATTKQTPEGKAIMTEKNSGPAEGVKGAVEDVKGKAKEAVGTVTGRDDMVREGKAQQDKADAQKDAAKKEAEAEAARGGAKAAEKRQEANQ